MVGLRILGTVGLEFGGTGTICDGNFGPNIP